MTLTDFCPTPPQAVWGSFFAVTPVRDESMRQRDCGFSRINPVDLYSSHQLRISRLKRADLQRTQASPR
jgi:hypothetical protein